MQIVEVVKSFAIIGWSGGISRTHLDSWLRVANFVLLSFFFCWQFCSFGHPIIWWAYLSQKGSRLEQCLESHGDLKINHSNQLKYIFSENVQFKKSQNVFMLLPNLDRVQWWPLGYFFSKMFVHYLLLLSQQLSLGGIWTGAWGWPLYVPIALLPQTLIGIYWNTP